MGGAAAGEVASRTAISTLVNLVLQTPDWLCSDGLTEMVTDAEIIAALDKHGPAPDACRAPVDLALLSDS